MRMCVYSARDWTPIGKTQWAKQYLWSWLGVPRTEQTREMSGNLDNSGGSGRREGGKRSKGWRKEEGMLDERRANVGGNKRKEEERKKWYIIKDNRKCIEHLSYILIYCVAIFDNITQVLLLFPNYELGNQSSESCSLFAAELGFRVQVPQTPACAPNQSFCELNRQPLRTKMKIRSCLFNPTQCLSRK